MKWIVLFSILLICSGCDYYYRVEFSPKLGGQPVSEISASTYELYPTRGNFPSKQTIEELEGFKLNLSFDNQLRSYITVELHAFEITDEDGRYRNLMENVTTHGPSARTTFDGRPIGDQTFVSGALYDMKEGRYQIHISGELCEGETCYPFEHNIEANLVFQKFHDFPTA